jgi:hypothetical protein
MTTSHSKKPDEYQGKLPNYRWIKFALNHLNDPAFMRISLLTKGVYFLLYLVAGEADAEGLLCSHRKIYDIDDLAWKLREDIKAVQTGIDELTEAGLIVDDDPGFKIANFLEEQGPGDNEQREAWRLRQQKHRARARKEPEQDSDKESELEENRLEEEERRIDKNRESLGRHGDVTVTSESSANGESLLLSSPFFSNLSGDERTLLEMIYIYPMNGELTPQQARYFLDCVKEHGEKKVLGYLDWCYSLDDMDWEKAINTDKKYKKIASWKVDGHITGEDMKRAGYTDITTYPEPEGV